MRPADQLQIVDRHKVGGHLFAEQPAGAARTLRPAVDVLRIGPDQVAEGALVGDLLVAVDVADLVERADLGAETAVYAENILVDDLLSRDFFLIYTFYNREYYFHF